MREKVIGVYADVVLRDDLRRFKKWSSIVGVVLDSQAGVLIVSLGESGMDLRVGCELRWVKKRRGRSLDRSVACSCNRDLHHSVLP